jgi:GT2 family glycosyltransferase
MRISVIIPSYKTPQYLNLALKSATENQVNTQNQIIAVIDGFSAMYEEVIDRYKSTVHFLVNDENKGQTYCHNTGVMLADNEQILIINDDNVFPYMWDAALVEAALLVPNGVFTPNQIEPTPSIFKSFVYQDFGTMTENFEYDKFVEFARSVSRSYFSLDGSTWPVCMSKKWYMILGGIDPNFPSPAVADWDFFLRCELAGLECKRYFGAHFYHFAGASTKATPEMEQAHIAKEQQSFEYFAHKWGYYPPMNANTHSHIDPTLPLVRGVRFLEENDGP